MSGHFEEPCQVSAELVVDQMEVGEFRPLGAGKFFHHEVHLIFIDALAVVGLFFVRGGVRHQIGFVDLPFNVGGAIESFTGER